MKKYVIAIVVAIVFFGIFIGWANHLKQTELAAIDVMVTPQGQPEVGDASKVLTLQLRWNKVGDIDLNKGVYSIDASCLEQSAKKEAQEISFSAASVTKLKATRLPIKEKSGLYSNRLQIMSGHSFDPLALCYPLDRQVLVYDIPENSKTVVSQFSVVDNAVPSQYKVLKTGTIIREKEDIEGSERIIRNYVIIQKIGLFSYINSNIMLWAAIAVCIAASFFTNESARVGGSIAALLLATTTCINNIPKSGQSDVLGFAQMTLIYYFCIFVIMLAVAVITFRNIEKIGVLGKSKNDDNKAAVEKRIKDLNGTNKTLGIAWIAALILFVAYYFLTYYIMVY